MITNPWPFSPSIAARYVAGKKPDRSSTRSQVFVLQAVRPVAGRDGAAADRVPRTSRCTAALNGQMWRLDARTPGTALQRAVAYTHRAGKHGRDGFFTFLTSHNRSIFSRAAKNS